jgi:uncharacterized protein involved in cysteine biosynthesis
MSVDLKKLARAPFEIVWFIFCIIAFIWLLAVFAFAFSHLADVLPSFLQFFDFVIDRGESSHKCHSESARV